MTTFNVRMPEGSGPRVFLRYETEDRIEDGVAESRLTVTGDRGVKVVVDWTADKKAVEAAFDKVTARLVRAD